MVVTVAEACKNLLSLIEQINKDRASVQIVSQNGNAVLISSEEYAALQETAHLLRSPANARRLLESLAQATRQPLSRSPLQ